MIRHKTLLVALMMLWGAFQVILWLLMVVMMAHSPAKVMDALFVFGAFSAVVTVWCYDYALKDTHHKERRHDKHETW